jgi:hypothetical protein
LYLRMGRARGPIELVEEPMHSADCCKYAEQCLQLARELPPEQRKLVLDLAERWLQAAAQLSAEEAQPRKTQPKASNN